MAGYPCAECKKECFSELLGTYLLVLIGPASIIIASLLPSLGALAAVFVGLDFGCTVTLAILLFGKYSGAHINPAITVAHGLARIMPPRLFVPYLIFQILGGLFAGFTLSWIFGALGNATSLGSTKLAYGTNPFAGVVLEAAGTFMLSISALIASSYFRNPFRQGLLVGTTLFVLILFIGPLTGAGFNPARSLGPSIASGYLVNQSVYWAGPMLGASLAGLIFGFFRRRGAPRKKFDIVCVC